MPVNFPTIGEYEQLFQRMGNSAFSSLHGLTLIPSKTYPIKIHLFGSGAYAAVFKASHNGRTFAIRCFLSSTDGNMHRIRVISTYLKNIHASWKADCAYYDNEISYNGSSYPIMKMEWVNGLHINDFVTKHFDHPTILTQLQTKLVNLSIDLEKNHIGHGDIQCGNVIIEESNNHFQIRLVDYDGMYVPELGNLKSIEKGRTEFQHPHRSLNDFGPEIDRFSFWVMLTALEAIKIDKSLWRDVMQGGFNTGDNFLFTIQDFLNPNQSQLFNRLKSYNNESLNFYIDKMKWMCNIEPTAIPRPALYGSTLLMPNPTVLETTILDRTSQPEDASVPATVFRIISSGVIASVLTSTFQKLGSTPIDLDRQSHLGKTLLISNGRDTKRVTLTADKNLIEVHFD